ncbi:MAG: D-alanine:D-lactate ligase-like protein [Alphaproteobacteria bacterium]|nr:D-alanine:D-lactate ligase-like protein [Alphaproteobacteria bacterium]
MRALILAERKEGCAARLRDAGFTPEVAEEIAFYLSQATDLQDQVEPILGTLDAVGVEGRIADPTEPAVWLDWLAERPTETVVWSVTDGIRYYRGSGAVSFARMIGAPVFGCSVQAQNIAQDKAKTGVVAEMLGVAAPAFGVMRDGVWLTPPPEGPGPWFVKPNTLGAKIGIWPDSKVETLAAAADRSRRIFARYRDDAVVQAFVPGADVRVSYMAVEDDPALTRLGVYRLETGGGGQAAGAFMTMADNATLSGLADTDGTATASLAGGAAFQPSLVDLADAEPTIAGRIAGITRRLAAGFGLRDLFSVDIRLGGDGTPWLLEVEVCPAVTIYDFRRYLDDQWGGGLPTVLARAFPRAVRRGVDV